jgi:hypothetical protein
MKIKKLILTLTVIMAGASLASAAMNIDAKAYHEQRQAEKKARLEADKRNPLPALVTPKLEPKAKPAAPKAKAEKEVEPVIEQPIVVAPEEKIEQLTDIMPEINAAVNAVDEQILDTTINAEQPASVEQQPQSL